MVWLRAYIDINLFVFLILELLMTWWRLIQQKEKIVNLEKTLSKVEDLGKEMRHDLRKNKDPAEVLEKFADRLIEIGGKTKNSGTTPLKNSKQSGSKGIFGRRQKAVK